MKYLGGKGETFADQYIDLSNTMAVQCTFRDCILFMRPGAQSHFRRTDFEDCDFLGSGWEEPFSKLRTRHSGRPKHEPEVLRAQRKAYR